MAEKIEGLGVPVQALNMPRGTPDPRGVWRLARLIRHYNPDVIQTWMYHADLIGGLAARIAGGGPVIWNIRHSNLHPKETKKSTIWTAKACALFSRRIPKKIVCCSEESRRVHADLGYAEDRMLVIPNGFDLEEFGSSRKARNSLRDELGLGQNDLLIGTIARFNPQKDHFTLIQAARQLKNQGVECFFLLCGQGLDWEHETLSSWIKKAGLEDRFFLLGPRSDISKITAALDVGCLSSAYGEGFPNILGEAMACEVPVVASDVGGLPELIVDGETGFLCPLDDIDELTECTQTLLTDEALHDEMAAAARTRAVETFDIDRVVPQYESYYERVRAAALPSSA